MRDETRVEAALDTFMPDWRKFGDAIGVDCRARMTRALAAADAAGWCRDRQSLRRPVTADQFADFVQANEPQRETIRRLFALMEHGGMANVWVRRDGREHHFEADWFRTIQQRPLHAPPEAG